MQNTKNALLIEEHNNKLITNMHFNINKVNIDLSRVFFDTGCSITLVSVKSTNIYIDQKKLLYDNRVKLLASYGVDSQDTMTMSHIVNNLNKLKHNNDPRLNSYIKMNENIILNSVNIRYLIKANNIIIDGLKIRNSYIAISFNTTVNLLGMNIIKQLTTKIYTVNNKTYLIATPNSDNANTIIEDNTYIDLVNQNKLAYTCINRIKDKHNRIIAYNIKDINNNMKTVSSDALKYAIRNKKITVENLVLTTDNRLILRR